MKLDFRIKECEFGRGLFATRFIAKGEIIEVSPIIKIIKKESRLLDKTILKDYVFEYISNNIDDVKYCIALGFGSLFNHNETPNINYEIDYKNDVIVFRSNRKIEIDEQLFIDYKYTLPRQIIRLKNI